MATDLGGLYYSLGIKTDNLKKQCEDLASYIQKQLGEGIKLDVKDIHIDEAKAMTSVQKGLKTVFDTINSGKGFGIYARISDESINTIESQITDLKNKMKGITPISGGEVTITPQVGEESNVAFSKLQNGVIQALQKRLNEDPNFQPIIKFRLDTNVNTENITTSIKAAIANVQNELNTITEGIDNSINRARQLIEKNGDKMFGNISKTINLDDSFKLNAATIKNFGKLKDVLVEIAPYLDALSKVDLSNAKINDFKVNVDIPSVMEQLTSVRQIVNAFISSFDDSPIKIKIEGEMGDVEAINAKIAEIRNSLGTIKLNVEFGNGNGNATSSNGNSGVDVKINTDGAKIKLTELSNAFTQFFQKLSQGTEVNITIPENIDNLKNLQIDPSVLQQLSQSLGALSLDIDTDGFKDKIAEVKSLLIELNESAQLTLGVQNLADILKGVRLVAEQQAKSKTTSSKSTEDDSVKKAEEAEKIANKVETKISNLRTKLIELQSLQSQSVAKGVDTTSIDTAVSKLKTFIGQLTIMQGRENSAILSKFDSGNVDVLLAHLKELVATQKEINANKVKPISEGASEEASKAAKETSKAAESRKESAESAENAENANIEKLQKLIALQEAYIARLKEQQAIVGGTGLDKTINYNQKVLNEMLANVGDNKMAGKWISDNFGNIDILGKKFEPLLNLIMSVENEITKLGGRVDSGSPAVQGAIANYEKFKESLIALVGDSTKLTTSLSGLNREWSNLKATSNAAMAQQKNAESANKVAEQMVKNIDGVIRSVQEKKGTLEASLILHPDSNALKGGISAYDDILRQLDALKASGTATAQDLDKVRLAIVQVKNETKTGLAKEGIVAKESESWAKVEESIAKVTKSIASLNSSKIKFDSKNLDTTNITTALQRLQTLMKSLERFKLNGDISGYKKIRAEVERILAEVKQTTAAEIANNNATIQTANAKKRAENEARKLAQAEEKSANAAARHLVSNKALHNSLLGNLSLMQSLGTQVANIYSIYTLENFLKKLIEIGGEIEKQKLAMNAILGSDYKTDYLFNQLKSLAVKSPFGLLNLTQFSKQLSSYGIQYSELYDTMKRLADISAGVGVDMGRIVLAYGQIRAAKFLKGTELRQLTEANIPMVDALAEHFSKLEHRMVSAGEIMDMISKKQIKFEDVKEVLWQMTGEGGQFYNMQEVLSESVSAKYKNLGDAIDIMYNNIAEGNSEILKAPAEILTKLTRNYQDFINVLSVVSVALGGYYAKLFIGNKAMGASTAELWKNAMAQKRLDAQEARRAGSVGKMTKAQHDYLRTSKAITQSELEQLAVTQNLSEAEMYAITLRQGLAKENYGLLLKYNLLNREELNIIKNGSKFSSTMMSMRVRMRLFGEQVKMATANLKAMFAEMLANPMTWVFALIVAGTKLYDFISKNKEEIANLHNEVNRAFTDIKTQADKLDGTKIEFEIKDSNGNKIGGGDNFADMSNYAKKMKDAYNGYVSFPDESAVKQRMDKLTEFIKAHVPTANYELNKIFALNDSKEFANSLDERLGLLEDLYQRVKGVANEEIVDKSTQRLGDIILDSWGFGDDGIMTDIKDQLDQEVIVRKALFERFNEIRKWNTLYIDLLKKDLGNGKMSDAQLVTELLKEGNEKYLKEISERNRQTAWHQTGSLFKEIFSLGMYSDIKEGVSVFIKARKEVNEEFAKLIEEMDEWGKGEFDDKFDLKNMTEDQKFVFSLKVTTAIDKLEATPEQKKLLQDKIDTYCNLHLNVQAENNTAQDFLDTFLGANNKFQIKDGSIYDRIETAGANLKKAKDGIKRLTDEASKFGKMMSKTESGKYTLSPGRVLNDEESKAAIAHLKELNSYVDEYERAMGILDKEGVDPSIFNTKKSKSSSGKKEDTQLKIWKEQFDELKKAYSEYQKWEAKVGKDQAAKHIEKSGIIDNALLKSLGLNIKNFADAPSYKSAIQKFYKSIQKSLQSSVERKKFDTQINVVVSDIDLNIKEEALQKAQEKVQREVNDAAKQYDLWKTWFEASGDSKFAYKMSLSVTPVWDERTADLKQQLESKLNEKGIDVSIFLKDAWNKDVSQIEMQKLFNNAELNEEYTRYKAIYDLIWSAGQETSKNLANVVKDLQTSADKISIIEDKYRRLIEEDKKATGGRNTSKLESARDYEKTQLSNSYIQYMKNNLTIAEDGVKDMADALKDKLTTAFKKGGITASKYADEIKKINDIQKKLNTKKWSGSGSFGNKSLQERFQEQMEQGEQMFNQGSQQYADALEANKKATQDMDWDKVMQTNDMMNSAQGMMDAGQAMSQGAQDGEMTLMIIDKIMHGINDTVQALKKVSDYLDEMFDSFGMDTGADTAWGQTKAYITGFAESSQHATNSWDSFKNGDFVGMATEIVGSITSIFVGFNKLHDAKLQAQIDKMTLQNTTLNNIYGQLQTLLEHTMGGIYNLKLDDDTRKQLQNIVNNTREYDNTKNAKYSSETQKAAQKALDSGSYYDAQFANLLAQRDNLQAMYDAENDKKDTDYSGLEDLRSQLSEINDEISYFAEDMMKSLYGIDFKDWASQLGDALIDAWAKGENAAEAYEETVRSLLNSVTKSVISQSIIETALEPVLKQFKQKFVDSSGKLDMSQIAWLGQQLGALYPQLNEAITQYLEQMQAMGLDLSETTSSSASSSIKSISEETADILASYINGMRLDFSIQRTVVEQIRDAIGADGVTRSLNAIAEAQLSQLMVIVTNTYNTHQELVALNSRIDEVTNGTKSLSVQ